MFVNLFLEANIRKEVYKLARKRADGEGSIYKRTVNRKDGTTYDRWEGMLHLGYDHQSGKRKRKVVYGRTQAEVLEKIEKVKRQVSDGTFSETKQTLGGYLDQYLENKSHQVKAITIDTYERLLRLHISPHLGQSQLSKIKAQDIRSMMYSVADNTGTRTANACRTLIYSALEQAVKDGLLARNICAVVDKLKHEMKSMNLWTLEEANRFLDVAKDHRLFAAFYLAMSTGMRRGELLALRWADIEGEVINVERSLNWVKGQATFTTPKTVQSQRRVSVASDVIDILEKHRNLQNSEAKKMGFMWPNTDLIFTSFEGTAMHPKSLTNSWWALQDKAKVPRIRLHDLRHLHISLLIKQGLDARTVADRVGHTDPSFTLRTYTHAFETQRKRAAISLNNLLQN